MRADRRSILPFLAATLLAAAALCACEKEIHRAARREFQAIMARNLPADRQAEALQRFVETYPEPKTNPYLARSCSLLAESYTRAGKPDLAASWYERAVRASPADPDLLNALGYHYAVNRMNLERAVAVLESAVRMAEERGYPARRQGFIKDSLGCAYRARGDLPLAVAILEEADRLAPGVTVIREHLADSYRALGERDKAVAIYLDLYLKARGADGELRRTLEAIGRDGGPASVMEVSRRIDAGLRDVANADRAATAGEGARLVQIVADDGALLAGSLFLPREASPRGSSATTGGVLLLHALGSNRRAATPAARALAERGLVALTLDFRGHGASVTEAWPGPHEFSAHLADSLRRSRDDVGAALAFLARQPRVDGRRLGVVGAGLGALIAAEASREGAPAAAALAILSPWGRADAYRPSLDALPPEAVLLVCGTEQESTRLAIEALAQAPGGATRKTIFIPGPGDGYDLETRLPELPRRLADFLGERLSRGPGR
jgi:dienelactone hydrolase/Flp pilus assembly protein TadD